MESHVYHCTGQSYMYMYVSVLSHCPMWDGWDSPMESHVYHCTVNPRRACAERVTVLGLCVCLSVCVTSSFFPNENYVKR